MSEIISLPDGQPGLQNNLINTSQDIVGVPVKVLTIMQNRIAREITQFRLGMFIFSGALWLGIERFFTVVMGEKGVYHFNDPLFIFCVASLFWGCWHLFFGYSAQRDISDILDIYLPQQQK